MSYTLTPRAKSATLRENIEPNLVMLIDGYSKNFAVRVTNQVLRYDIPGLSYDDPGLFYDGLVADENSYELINVSGTTTTISAQLEPDKGTSNSTQTLTVQLIDKNELISELISPGVVLPEILYRGCQVFFGMHDTAFPDDYLEIFNGKIMEVKSGPGTIDLVVTHPDDMKRAKTFQRAEATLTQAAHFDSANIQDLFYQKRSDVVGAVTVEYTSAALGDDAVVSVSGNAITVQIDTAFTKAKTVKKKVENHEDANQLVTVSIKGNANAVQAVQALTTLASSTEIFVEDVKDFLLPNAPLFRTFCRISDEIIEYTGIDPVLNKLTGCTRQSLTSFGATHKIGDTASSFYKLGDGTSASNAIDLALYVMLSGGDEFYFTGEATDFAAVPTIGALANAIYFPGIYLSRDHNVVVGDIVDCTGSVSNDFTGGIVTAIGSTDSGSYITVSGPTIVYETLSTATISIKSKYNILPDGAAMIPAHIDLKQFAYIKNTFVSSIANYEIYLKDTIDTKSLVNEQLFMPSAMYSVPRKGRVSVGITAPPLYDANSQVLTLTNVKNPKAIKINRGVAKNFYNTIVYQYNPDSVEDRYLNKNVSLSGDSALRIESNAKIFQVKSDGLRPGPDASALINRNSRRFLERYKFAAQGLKVDVLFKTGIGIEVGDAVLFGDASLQLTDINKGNKDFDPKLMEVLNKEWNWKTGAISLTLLDTAYSNDVRYGVLSPSTIIDSGSTTTVLAIKDSYGTVFPSIEKDKWQNYIQKEISVHSEDWSVEGKTYIQGFDSANNYRMIVAPALSFTPAAGYIIDIVNYNDVDTLESFYKNVHVFYDPTVAVVSGASSTSFDVSLPDAAKFFLNCLIRVHNYDYSIDSGLVNKRVTAISGTTITCDDLGFTPDNTMVVELIGFSSDNGKPYAWI